MHLTDFADVHSPRHQKEHLYRELSLRPDGSPDGGGHILFVQMSGWWQSEVRTTSQQEERRSRGAVTVVGGVSQ
jgi:hypothetical protein